MQRCRHKGQQPGEGSSSMPRILHSRIPKTGAVASSRRVQTARHSWRVILTYLLLLYPHLDKFLLFEKCANYVRYFCVTMCKNYVLNRALVWTSCSIYCAWTKYSILCVLARHTGVVLNLRKFDFVRHVWMGELSRWSSRVALFLVFCHSFPELLKDLKLPCCMGRAVINAKESDSCQTASVMAFVKSSRC